MVENLSSVVFSRKIIFDTFAFDPITENGDFHKVNYTLV